MIEIVNILNLPYHNRSMRSFSAKHLRQVSTVYHDTPKLAYYIPFSIWFGLVNFRFQLFQAPMSSKLRKYNPFQKRGTEGAV